MYSQILIPLLGLTSFLLVQAAQVAQVVHASQRNSFKSDHISQVAGGFDGRGRPRSRTSGGTRGDCLNHLIALIPGVEEVKIQAGECVARSESLPTLTLTNTPKFWFYVPAFPEPGMAGEFVLLDSNEQPIWSERVVLPNRAGIISVSPSQPLEIGQQYQWIFSILVNPHSPSQNLAVEGLIQIGEPDANLSRQLAAATSQTEYVDLYQQHGIWQDVITALANSYCTNSQNAQLAASWSGLLTSAGLKAIADAPLYCDFSQPVSN